MLVKWGPRWEIVNYGCKPPECLPGVTAGIKSYDHLDCFILLWCQLLCVKSFGCDNVSFLQNAQKKLPMNNSPVCMYTWNSGIHFMSCNYDQNSNHGNILLTWLFCFHGGWENWTVGMWNSLFTWEECFAFQYQMLCCWVRSLDIKVYVVSSNPFFSFHLTC